jgi:hypothetical protein
MRVKEKKTDLLQGTFDLLMHKARTLGPLHSLSVFHRIRQIARGAFQTKAAERQLEAETADWQQIALAITSVLKAT